MIKYGLYLIHEAYHKKIVVFIFVGVEWVLQLFFLYHDVNIIGYSKESPKFEKEIFEHKLCVKLHLG